LAARCVVSSPPPPSARESAKLPTHANALMVRRCVGGGPFPSDTAFYSIDRMLSVHVASPRRNAAAHAGSLARGTARLRQSVGRMQMLRAVSVESSGNVAAPFRLVRFESCRERCFVGCIPSRQELPALPNGKGCDTCPSACAGLPDMCLAKAFLTQVNMSALPMRAQQIGRWRSPMLHVPCNMQHATCDVIVSGCMLRRDCIGFHVAT
jgi:hypothetical protein